MSNETSYAAYREAVEEIGKEARSARDVSDAVHEAVDGSWWIIYTHASIAVLTHSTNDDAVFEEQGSDALSGCSSMSEVYTRAAYYAMVADVHAWIAENPAEEDEDEDEDEPRTVDQEAFDEELSRIVNDETGDSLLAIPGIYEILAEHFNNQILDALAEDEDE